MRRKIVKPDARIVIADTLQEAIIMKQQGGILISNPANLVADFLAKQLFEDKQLVYSDKRIDKNQPIRELKADFKPAILKMISKPILNNTNSFLEKVFNEEEQFICTPEGGVLLIEYASKNGLELIDMEIEAELTHLCDIYSELKNPIFYPIAMERLFKLFCIFYNKKLTTDENSNIALFQKVLTILDKQNNLEHLKTELISQKQDILTLIEKMQTVVARIEALAPLQTTCNIFNKIQEELNSFHQKLDFVEEIELKKETEDDFLEIHLKRDLSDEFINMYTSIL